MAQLIIKATPQLDADRRLLQFETYESYLDHFRTGQDECYLQNLSTTRKIAELGYRSTGETLSREQFERRLATVIGYLYPPYKPYELASEGIHGGDPIQIELAIRERPNRIGVLATIIFLRYINRKGFEISGYIDYRAKLTTMDWTSFFKDGKRFYPTSSDLAYYHWKQKKTISNDTVNYKVKLDQNRGLVFQNRNDRMLVIIDPKSDPGTNTRRRRIESNLYQHVILYDHVVRQRV